MMGAGTGLGWFWVKYVGKTTCDQEVWPLHWELTNRMVSSVEIGSKGLAVEIHLEIPDHLSHGSLWT